MKSINQYDDFILIDDARFFVGPPPRPHNPNMWPDIYTVLVGLSAKPRYVFILDDIIVAIPLSAKTKMLPFFQVMAEDSWKRLNQNNLKNQNRLMQKISKLIKS